MKRERRNVVRGWPDMAYRSRNGHCLSLSLSLSMDTRGWERGKEAEMGKGWEEEKRVMEIMAWAVG